MEDIPWDAVETPEISCMNRVFLCSWLVLMFKRWLKYPVMADCLEAFSSSPGDLWALEIRESAILAFDFQPF